MSAVLDASALLAWLRHEDGAEQVDAVLHDGILSAVNASEVVQKLNQNGADGARALTQVLGLGLVVVPFGADDALATAALWATTRTVGLSPGDRACLATGLRLQRPVLTADTAWKRLDANVGIEVQLLR